MVRLFVLLAVIALAIGVLEIAQSPTHDRVSPTLSDEEVGGTRITYGIDPALDPPSAARVATTLETVLNRRFDGMGWAGARVRRDGMHVVADVPGVSSHEATRVGAAPGALRFRLARTDAPPETPLFKPYRGGGSPALALNETDYLTNADIIDAWPGVDRNTQRPIVTLRLNAAGAKALADVTARNVGETLAIVLDDKILTAPRILAPITGGMGQISGPYTVVDVREIAALMRGALPDGVKVLGVETVSPKR